MARAALRRVVDVAGSAAVGEVVVGRVVDVRDGRPWVEFDAPAGPLRACARIVQPAGLGASEAALRDASVLLVAERGDWQRPILVGMVQDRLTDAVAVTARADGSVEIDAGRLFLSGREEVVLRCGDATISLKADGQVVVKGTRLTSRATGTHKIRGATVLIN